MPILSINAVSSQQKKRHRLVVWVESDIQKWIVEQIASARGQHPSFLCLQTIIQQKITPAIHKFNPFIQELRFVIRLTDLSRWFMTHLQIDDMERGLQNVRSIGQRHVPDTVSDKFALIPHPLDQMVGCI